MASEWQRELDVLKEVIRAASPRGTPQLDTDQCATGVLLLATLPDELLLLADRHLRMEFDRRGYDTDVPVRRRASTTLAPEPEE